MVSAGGYLDHHVVWYMDALGKMDDSYEETL